MLEIKKESFQPIIKWSGSKRSQAHIIISYFGEYRNYYEPFIGGGAVLYAANPLSGVAGDINKPLIDLWNEIKYNPNKLADEYESRWNNLQAKGHLYYYEVRERFNNCGSPYDLLFLSRTCVNGLIRYNNYGKFNNSFHHSRPGINPKTLKNTIMKWSIRIANIQFIHADYRQTTKDAKEGDLVYLDPPYFSTKGRYFGTIDYSDFIEYLYDLKKRKINYILSYDGTRDDISYIVDIPKDLYNEHILLESGNSTFRKVIDKKIEKVYESLYIG
ncbi:DNA adenine methylase [Metaclostridioides mangenotii]|uniref:DNA adenine methylase n=1 Tax=Metaclostridioides mangenotii TaxID=1540 RepID=UPI0004650E7F|nr:DNA adenine methylase [Clostridioides mangenotii]